MNFDLAERFAQALLFEGYLLNPYRASSFKNCQRWAFGSLYPPAFCEAAAARDSSTVRTECLIVGGAPIARIAVRFLQLVARPDELGLSEATPLAEAIERRIELTGLFLENLVETPRTVMSLFPGSRAKCEGVARVTESLSARVIASATRQSVDLWKLSVSVYNESNVGEDALDRGAAQLRTLISTHTLLGVECGRFVSMLEPPETLASYVGGCRNEGTWPVLVGSPDLDDTMLSSPVILYDRPKEAEESPGNLFDATLTTVGEPTAPPAPASETRLKPGDRVVLRPAPRGDVLDLVLAGEAATVCGVEEDVEGRVYYTVTVDADSRRDLGEQGQPGHRFFFTRDELEPRR